MEQLARKPAHNRLTWEIDIFYDDGQTSSHTATLFLFSPRLNNKNYTVVIYLLEGCRVKIKKKHIL